MTQETEFYVQALWDEEANVYYSRSNIKGLHIEADTLDEFYDIATHFAKELIAENYPNKEVSQKTSLRDLITPVFFRPPPTQDILPTTT